MARLDWLRKAKCLSFKNPTMESEYQKRIRDIDTRLFLAFGVFLLAITTLDAALSLATHITDRNLALVILQIVLPFVALLIRKVTLSISRIVFLAAILIFLYSLFKDFATFYPNSLPGQFFYIGNVIGMCEVVLIAHLQNFWYKLLLSICVLLLKLLTIRDGFLFTTSNLIGIVVVTLFMLISFLYQETLNRRSFKSIYESQERFRKFQSLLSDDFPISVLIVSANFRSILYSNSLFNQCFKDIENNNYITPSRLFEKFELDIDPTILGPEENYDEVLLEDFVEALRTNKNGLQEKNLMILPAIYKANRVPLEENQSQHYEIKLRKIIWDLQESYAIIFNDVSEKHIITALKLADEQKDRVIATVSHELRTPIHGTLGLLEMIEDRLADDLTKKYLRYCKSCNKLLLYLVNSILDLSQLRHNTLRIVKETFALDEFLEELKSLYIFQCQAKGVELLVEKHQNVPKEIYTDRYRLTEILINLMGNAVKFTFQGSVTLEVGLDTEDNDKLRFSVIDTGIGVKDEHKPLLFRMFGKIQHEDVNINTHGVGLGLAIVKELLIALNDYNPQENIRFDSVYGKGSTFSFSIKYQNLKALHVINHWSETSGSEVDLSSGLFKEHRQKEHVPDTNVKVYDSLTFSSIFNQTTDNNRRQGVYATKEIEKLDKKPVKSSNILVVDDNALNILAATFILQKLKFNVGKAFNGQECINELERTKQQGKHYDLILMDIQMPVLDGPNASKIIHNKIQKGELDDVPIIALTAKKSTEEDEIYYKSCGIQAVLEKPLDMNKLLKIIESYIK